MTGLLMLGVLGVWASLCGRIAWRIVRPLDLKSREAPATVLIWLALLLLIVFDELTAIPEFRRVCRERAVLMIDHDEPAGTVVWFGDSQARVQYFGLLRGTVRRWQYVVAGTTTPAFHYHSVGVKGGFLIRALGISQTNSPLILDGSCVPREYPDLERWISAHGMSQITRPLLPLEGNK